MAEKSDSPQITESFPCPKCGRKTSLCQTECEHCGSDLATFQTTISMANLHFNRALELTHENRLNEAILELQTALELWNRNPKFHNLLGKVLARKGLFSRAIIQWETALKLDSSSATAYECIQRAKKLEGFYPQQQSLKPLKRAVTTLALLSLVLLMAWFNQCSNRRELEERTAELEKQNHHLELSLERMKGERSGLLTQLQPRTEEPLRPQVSGRASKPSASDEPSEEVLALTKQVGSLREAVSQKDTQIERYKRMVAGAQQESASASSRAEALTERLIEWDRLLNERSEQLKIQEAQIRENEQKNHQYTSSLQNQLADLKMRLARFEQESSEEGATPATDEQSDESSENGSEESPDEDFVLPEPDIVDMELDELRDPEDMSSVVESVTNEP